jgi:membrane protease YdiL (CAAX protease family)
MKGCSVQARKVVASKIGGLIFLGIIPLIIIIFTTDLKLHDLGLNLLNLKTTAIWLAILLPLPIIINFFAAKKPGNLEQYPQIRDLVWPKALVAKDLFAWAMYLLGYEVFFRGIMLFGLASVLGPWTSIMINVMAYAFVHIPKGARETIGSAPLGLLLCLICLHTGNIWVAFLVHVSLAWSNELFSLKYHPEIRIAK